MGGEPTTQTKSQRERKAFRVRTFVHSPLSSYKKIEKVAWKTIITQKKKIFIFIIRDDDDDCNIIIYNSSTIEKMMMDEKKIINNKIKIMININNIKKSIKK